MDLVNDYYSKTLGHLPDESCIEQTRKTIQYLIDCGYTEEDISMIFYAMKNAKESLIPDDLPDSLWKDSLIERGRFYYHNTLRITSAPPYYDNKLKKEVVTPFFLEMRIRYTLDDLLKYYAITINPVLINEKRDKGALNSIVNQYNDLGFISGLDFTLALIDTAKYKYTKIMSPFNITKNEAEVYERLHAMYEESKAEGNNVIVWR